jgi:hypothetical protein
MKLKAKQYTIRNVSKAVDRALRKKAAEKQTSLNAVLLSALEKEAGLEMEETQYHDLDFLIGSWVADPVTEQALLEERKIDPRDWK